MGLETACGVQTAGHYFLKLMIDLEIHTINIQFILTNDVAPTNSIVS